MDAESQSLFLRLLEAEASPTCRRCHGPKSRTDTIWCDTCTATNNAAWENACTCPWDRPLSETTCEPCGAQACPKGDRKHYVGPACPSCGWVRPEVLEDP